MGLLGHNECSAACLRRAYDTRHPTHHARSFSSEGPAWPVYTRYDSADDARRKALHAGDPPFRGIYSQKGRYTNPDCRFEGPSGAAGRGVWVVANLEMEGEVKGEGEGRVLPRLPCSDPCRSFRKPPLRTRGLTGVEDRMSARWGGRAPAPRIIRLAHGSRFVCLYHTFNLHCNHVHI